MRMSVMHDVRPSRLDRSEQRIEIATRGDDVEVGLCREQAPDALADEVVVLGEHQANRQQGKNTAQG